MSTTKTKKPSDNGSKNRVKDALKETTVKIQPLNVGRLNLTLKGLSPLVVHNFGDKARRQMLESQMATSKAKKEPRCPVEEFLDAFYILEGEVPQPTVDEQTKQRVYDEKEVAKFLSTATFGLPITGFKNAVISACRNTDFTMTQMRQSLFFTGTYHHDWAVIESDDPPSMDSRICRLAGAARTPVERFRPIWNEWSTKISVQFDANLMTPDQVANIVAIAGYYVGVFEGRPERSSLGWGRFELVNEKS